MGAKHYNTQTVSLSRPLGMRQRDNCRFSESGGKTLSRQLQLKSLATAILQRNNTQDKKESVACKIVSSPYEKNALLSHSQKSSKARLQGCIYCDFWEAKQGSVWWYGLCGLNGQRISHKGKCNLGLWRWNNG